jgi:hypothetical protein
MAGASMLEAPCNGFHLDPIDIPRRGDGPIALPLGCPTLNR